MPWIDDFEGNKLSHKWVATRYSSGGQYDGVWIKEVNDSKLYIKPTSVGTESAYWGEYTSLPVSATGDIKIDAHIRQKRNSGSSSLLGVGVNQSVGNNLKYGVSMIFGGGVVNYLIGNNNFVQTPFPARPTKTYAALSADQILSCRIVRKNGFLFLYGNSFYLGQYAFAATITTVDIVFVQYQNDLGGERWIDWIKVWPASVVL